MFTRNKTTYSRTDLFVQREKNYTQQYSHIYVKRLLFLRSSFGRWTGKRAEKIIGLVVEERSTNEGMLVIGTLYKEQKLKPCVLDEFSNDFGYVPPPARENYAGDDDALILEDESGRCSIVSDPNHFTKEEWATRVVGHLVTGVVVGCVGRLDAAGHFVVSQIVYPGESLPSRPLKSLMPPSNPPRFLLLASDLMLGTTDSLALEFFLDYVNGNLNPALGASIVRVVVAGGVLSRPLPREHLTNGNVDAKLSIEQQEILARPLREADRWLAELASSVPIELMPGEFDPCNTSLPQQPMHECLFPTASRYSTFNRVTNPHAFVLGDQVRVVGHSGQPVTDALKYTFPGACTAMDFLEATVTKYRHIAPSAPDTLNCYPFYDRDPFTLETDDVSLMFSGGRAMYETRLSHGTRFVCIPSFHTTKSVVLVNLDSCELETRVVSFASDL